MNRHVLLSLAAATGCLLALPESAFPMNDPVTGRWASRDPLGVNRGGVVPGLSVRANGVAIHGAARPSMESITAGEALLVMAPYRSAIPFSADPSGLCDAPKATECDLTGGHGPGPHFQPGHGGERPCVCHCIFVHELSHAGQMLNACLAAQAAYAACGSSEVCQTQLKNRWKSWNDDECNIAHEECVAYNDQISCLHDCSLIAACGCDCAKELKKPILEGPPPQTLVDILEYYCQEAATCGPPRPFVP